MTLVRKGAISALALATALTAQTANAQAFRGFRAEVQAGYDQFNSEGNHHSKLGVGGAAGADFYVGSNFVLGPEITFWWAPNENRTHDGAGIARRKSFEEWALALRAGAMVTPDLLLYGKVGYVRNEQRKLFVPDVGVCGGNACQAPGYYEHFHTGGWQWGLGANYMLTNNLYVSAEGRYSDYNNARHLGGTHRIVGLLGLGVLFGPRAEEVVPPPPPPPPPPAAPATQTCPDGSVILATDTCPAPPPPPPPPAQRGERGE